MTDIEYPVNLLCDALNKVPNTKTIMSCGGHYNVEKRCPCSAPITMVWVEIETTNPKLQERMIPEFECEEKNRYRFAAYKKNLYYTLSFLDTLI
jgi:hypothetical protein